MSQQGFKPILDDCDYAYGAVDEPNDGDATELSVEVVAPDDTREQYDAEAVGIMESAGVTMVHLFAWKELNQDKIREMSEQAGVSVGEVEQELKEMGDDEMLVLERTFTYERIFEIRLSDDGMGLFQ